MFNACVFTDKHFVLTFMRNKGVDDFDRSTTLRAIFIICRAMKKQHLKTVNTFANALDKVSPVSL